MLDSFFGIKHFNFKEWVLQSFVDLSLVFLQPFVVEVLCQHVDGPHEHDNFVDAYQRK